MSEPRRARGGVLVVGGGFAGSYVARLLGRTGATVVSRENYMLYTPLLPEAAAGTLEPRHVVVPLRMMCPHAELLLGTATTLDEQARTLAVTTMAGEQVIAYDRLVDRGRGGRAHASDPRARRARPRLQGPRRRDRAAKPRPARARGRVRRAGSRAGRQAPDVRLRRSRLRGRRGARRAVGPRARGASLLPGAARRSAALGARGRGAHDSLRDPEQARRVRHEGALAARRGHTGLDDARAGRGRRRRAVGRRADRDEDARVDGRRPRQPVGRDARAAARRARPRPRGSHAAGRGPRERLVARRLRAGSERGDARTTRTRPPASTRSARRDGSRRTSRGRPGRTATACSARWRRSAGTRESPRYSGSSCADSWRGSWRARTTCTSCRSSPGSCASSWTGRSRSFSGATSPSSGCSVIRARSARSQKTTLTLTGLCR